MSPVTHFLAGWLVANSADLNRRERALVAVAGVVPDVDGFGIVVEVLTRNSAHPLNWWSEFHHLLGHNIALCTLMTAVAFVFAQRKWLVAALVALSFHLHLLGDIIGARGPDGHQWPIPYLFPFSTARQITWDGQWPLNGWPNMLLTAMALGATLFLAWRRGFSPLEMFSSRADRALVETLRRRFPKPASAN